MNALDGTSLDLGCHLNVVVGDLAELRPEALASLAASGYRRVILPPVDPESFDVGAMRAMLADAGLAAITLATQGPGANVASDDAAEREAGEEALRDMADLTVALGSDQMNGVPYGLFGPAGGPVSAEAFERSALAVGRIADYAHERGVTMTFEVLNRYETAVVNTAAQAMAYAEASGSPHLRIHLDTFHMAIEEADTAEAIRTALPRLGYLELGQSGRGPLATGAVDVAGVVRAAIEAGYTGRFGVEAFSRSELTDQTADMLAIWRSPFDSGLALAEDAARLIAGAWAAAVR